MDFHISVDYSSCLINDYSETENLDKFFYSFDCTESNRSFGRKINKFTSNGYYSIRIILDNLDFYDGLEGYFYASQSKLGLLSPEFAWHYILNIFQLIIRLFFFITWIVLCFMYKKSIIHIQIVYGIVLLIGSIENIVFLDSYRKIIGNIGQSFVNLFTFGYFMSSLRLVITHYLLIAIAMGFSITRAFGGRQFKWTLIAVAIYAIFQVPRAFFVVDYSVARTISITEMILTIASIFVEVVLIFWYAFLMKTTIQEIRTRKTTGKLKPYNWMTVISVISVLVSISYIITTTVFSRIKGKKNCRYVQDLSIDNSIWMLIMSFVEFSLFFIWKPSKNTNNLSDGAIVDFTDDLYSFYNPNASRKEDNDSYSIYERPEISLNQTKMRRFKSLQENDTHSLENDSVAINDERESFIKKEKFDPSKDDPLQWIENNVPSVSLKDPTVILDENEVIYEKNNAISKIQ